MAPVAPQPEPTPSEAELVARVAQGDAGAYRALADRHLPGIVAYAHRLLGRREEAEEVAQETFLRLWQQADRYRPSAKPSTWLYRIAHNLAVDRLRKRRETSESHWLDEAPGSGRPSSLLSQKQTVTAIREAVAALAPRQRAALGLVHYEGLTGAEAAEVLGVKVEAVESLLSRARRRLRVLLQPLVAPASPASSQEDVDEP